MKKVLVVTRTRDRGVFLARAAASIGDQRFRNLHWVIVNDGGDPGPVDEFARRAAGGRVEVSALHLGSARGMEAASNAGIASAPSEYVVIHDDDDTWEPGFLEATVGFLESPGGLRYGGVVTRSTSVLEEFRGGGLRTVERAPFNPGLCSVGIADLARENVFTTNSFVFRRSAYQAVGPYDESLPVRGDWDFNLRFIRAFDIGVVPEALANYHRRVAGEGAGANTVTGHGSLHRECDTIIRNRLLRDDLEKGRVGLGFLVAVLGGRQRIFPPKTAPSLVRRVLRALGGGGTPLP
jgi:glycosyltransferase involved in cell wall biosynthesis